MILIFYYLTIYYCSHHSTIIYFKHLLYHYTIISSTPILSNSTFFTIIVSYSFTISSFSSKSKYTHHLTILYTLHYPYLSFIPLTSHYSTLIQYLLLISIATLSYLLFLSIKLINFYESLNNSLLKAPYFILFVSSFSFSILTYFSSSHISCLLSILELLKLSHYYSMLSSQLHINIYLHNYHIFLKTFLCFFFFFEYNFYSILLYKIH